MKYQSAEYGMPTGYTRHQTC